MQCLVVVWVGRTYNIFVGIGVVPFSGIGFTFLDYFLGVIDNRTSNRHKIK
nr:MAG TPA: hypothetical protein [Caudoviricetes sp.]